MTTQFVTDAETAHLIYSLPDGGPTREGWYVSLRDGEIDLAGCTRRPDDLIGRFVNEQAALDYIEEIEREAEPA